MLKLSGEALMGKLDFGTYPYSFSLTSLHIFFILYLFIS